MNEELDKDNSKKNQNNDFQMNFEEENHNPFEQKSAQNNPFDSKEEDNPFLKNDPNKAPFNFTNENIEANRTESRGLSKVLLVLLVSIGLLVTAIWGLNQKKNPGQNTQSRAKQNQSAKIDAEKKSKEIAVKENNGDKASFSLTNTKNNKGLLNNSNSGKESAIKYDSCKIDEAQRYIASSMNDLDRVVSKVEQKTDEIKTQPDDDRRDEMILFLKDKVEKLSRAEEEIRAFAEPHIEKDLTLVFDEITNPCKVKDRPKYLAAWLDNLKQRVDTLNNVLDQLENGETLIASIDKQVDKPSNTKKVSELELKKEITTNKNKSTKPINQSLNTQPLNTQSTKGIKTLPQSDKLETLKSKNNTNTPITKVQANTTSPATQIKKVTKTHSDSNIQMKRKIQQGNIEANKVETKPIISQQTKTKQNTPKTESSLSILEDKSLNAKPSRTASAIMDKPLIPTQKIPLPTSADINSKSTNQGNNSYQNTNTYEEQYEPSVDQCIEYVEEQIDQCSTEGEYEYSNPSNQNEYNYHPISNCRGEAY